MFPPQAGTDDQGNVFIPFIATNAEIPFAHWLTTTKKIFQSDGPIVIQSIIISSQGEIFVQYTEPVHDANEFPTDGKVVYTDIKSAYPESLVTKDEKRSYE